MQFASLYIMSLQYKASIISVHLGQPTTYTFCASIGNFPSIDAAYNHTNSMVESLDLLHIKNPYLAVVDFGVSIESFSPVHLFRIEIST